MSPPTSGVDNTTSEMKPTGLASPLYGQTVKFQGTDEQHSTEITSADVTIVPSLGNHDKGSSSVKTKNIVDHSWDVRFYKGQLLAVHMSGKFIAFGIQVVSKCESMVRIVNRQNNHRYLCKGITGLVQDIAFAHIPTQVLLGIVDEAGTLFVYRFQDTKDALQTKLVLHITRPYDPQTNQVSHRLIWCPYIPEEDGDCSKDSDYEDVANMLVVTHGPKAEMWNVGMVVQAHGTEKELQPDDVKEGMLTIEEHAMDIVDASFSPDGTALATASLDGYVKFFQAESALPLVSSSAFKVYMHGEGKPRCLHMWQPHEGRPLSSLFFLDNHRTFNADVQYWKYAITGSENNSELKIWSCETWTCLQTIRFSPNPASDQSSISLKAGIDLSADFIMLSDITNRVLYVLQIQKDMEESSARICAISEFLLPNPILSFGIVDAGIRYMKCHHDRDDLETDLVDDNANSDGGEDDDDDEKSLQVVVRMYVVHPKSLRGCIITFDPPNEAKKSVDIFSQDTLRYEETTDVSTQSKKEFTDALSDVPDKVLEKISTTSPLPKSNHSKELLDLSQPAQSMHLIHNLMTPADFSSSNDKDDDNAETPVEQVSERSAERLSENTALNSGECSAEKSRPQADSASNHDAAIKGISKNKGKSNGKAMNHSGLKRNREPTASGGSSPSREVEEILSHGSSDRISFSVGLPILEDVSTSCLSECLSTGVSGFFGISSAPVPEDVSTRVCTPPTTSKTQDHDQLAEASLKLDLIRDQEMKTQGERNGNSAEGSTATSSAENSSSLLRSHTTAPSAVIPIPLPAAAISTTSALQAVVAAAQEKPVMVSADQLEKQQTQWSRVYLLLEQQQSEIKALRQEISVLRVAQASAANTQSSGQLESILRSQQQQQQQVIQSSVQASVQNSVQNAVQIAVQNAVQSVLRQRDQQEAQRQEVVLSAVSQSVGNLVTSQLPVLIAQEMKSEVVPLVHNTVQQMKQQVAAEVVAKLTATDQLLKDNIVKLVSNKTIMDKLSQSIVTMSQSAMQNLYKESLSSLVPGMEKITQNMFHQINSSFSKGTQEYMQYVDSNLEKQRRQVESAQQMLHQMQALAEKLSISHEQQNVVLKNTLENQMQRIVNSLQDKLNKTVSETVKGNLAQGFKQQKAVIEESVLTSLTAVRSRAVSPAVHSATDYALMERQIMQHVQDGQLNLAFQQALSASNINLVLILCERVDPQMLFSQQPFPLKQNILLSLIQQLSLDLSENTDLKRRYLEEAVMNLDQHDPDVRKHLYIITNLQEHLMKYIHANPTSPITRQIRMLWMATSKLVST